MLTTRKQRYPKTVARRFGTGNEGHLGQSLEGPAPNAEVADSIQALRVGAGLTQKELATLVGTATSVICRLENARYTGHSVAMLRRVATALGKCVEIRFVSPADAPVDM
jgi:ribosome-binding protein aMBF1 (putative translation factor)